MHGILDVCTWIKIYPLILISLMQIACSSMTDGEVALANFTKKFNQEISKEYGLFLFGSGASFPVKIEHIILSYQADYCSDVIEARKLAIEISDKMIERMNEDKNLLKYLSSNPASFKQVNLTIGFKQPNNCKTSGALDSVMVIGPRGKIFFDTYNEAKTKIVTLHEETFEEAERIVKQQSLNKLKNDPSTDK